MRRYLQLLIVCAGLITAATVTLADVSADVRALTGGHTRIVWIRDAGETSDPLGEHSTSILMGFDSDDGKGERVILSTVGNYQKPVITDDGSRVVFGNVVDKKIYVVNWNGTGLRAVVENASMQDVWTDPATKIDWVYALVKEIRAEKEVSVLRRFRMDDAAISEIVWDKTPAGNFQISGDGKAASGGAGKGNGLFILPNDSFSQFYGGCWPSMSPDDSHRMWIFRGHHKGVHLFYKDFATRTQTGYPVEFLGAPGVPTNNEVYHPRWSNNIRFFTITGGYWYRDWKWSDPIKLSNEAAAKVELYLGKFNESLDGTEGWVKITSNDRGDFLGDAWVDPKQVPNPLWTPPTATAGAEAAKAWPGDLKGLVFIWEDKIKTNQVVDATGDIHLCALEPRDRAVYARYHVMDTTGGAFLAEDERNTAILAACKASNQLTLEAMITPANLDQQGVIVSFAGKTAQNFTLWQDGSKLILNLLTTASNNINYQGLPANALVLTDKLMAGKPTHVVISYSPGKMYCFINGGQAMGTDSRLGGTFDIWTPGQLVFGDLLAGGKNWSGTIEGVTISNRTMGVREAQQRLKMYSERFKTRTTAEKLVVQAKLIDTTAAPDPASIMPYRRCLSVNIYEVEKVIEGNYTEKQLAVVQWSVLNAKFAPAFQNFKKGQSYTLALEKYSDHPELESERMVFDMAEPDMPLYYDISR